MKLRFSPLVIMALFLISSFTIMEPSSVNIQIGEKGVLLNNVNISYGWKLTTVQEVIGKTKNVSKGRKSNRIHMYDDLGIMLYEGPKNSKEKGHVKAMDVFFDLAGHGTYYTQHIYSGKIKIEDLDLDKNVKLETIKAKLTNWKQEKISIDHWYKFYRNDVYIYFMYNDDETSLLEISLGEQI